MVGWGGSGGGGASLSKALLQANAAAALLSIGVIEIAGIPAEH